MNRLKKIYCSASFIFACVVLISTILNVVIAILFGIVSMFICNYIVDKKSEKLVSLYLLK